MDQDQVLVRINEREASTDIALSGPLTVDRIEEVRVGLLRAFALGKSVRISLAAVTDVDLTGLQLLCSAHRTSIARELDLRVTSDGCPALSSVAGVAGMLRHIGCPQDGCGTCVWKGDSALGREAA